MRAGFLSLGIGCGALLLSACLAYKPTLFLDRSPATIPAKVLVQPLRDASPADDKEHAAAQSFSQTSRDSLEENLSTSVTRAILAEFSATSVFQSVGRTERNPDLILSGTIYRFYGEVTIPSWAMIPGVAWAVNVFWSPAQERHGEVDIELTLVTPEGEVLGRYRGCDTYEEIGGPEKRYWSMPVYPAHSRLNRSFTDVVRYIRNRMLEDRERLMAARARPPSPGRGPRPPSGARRCPASAGRSAAA